MIKVSSSFPKLIFSWLQLVSTIDPSTSMLPIEMATEQERSHFIVYQLLLLDLPLNLDEKEYADMTTEHKGSWFHLLSNTYDKYYPVIQKVLSQCTQAQVSTYPKNMQHMSITNLLLFRKR